jgi:hypothetical protein
MKKRAFFCPKWQKEVMFRPQTAKSRDDKLKVAENHRLYL